jgi:hypothetical protein
MDVIKNLTTGLSTYTPTPLLTKNAWQDRMYLLPLERNEFQRNKELAQTDGWQ